MERSKGNVDAVSGTDGTGPAGITLVIHKEIVPIAGLVPALS